jgi:hypothetical protein
MHAAQKSAGLNLLFPSVVAGLLRGGPSRPHQFLIVQGGYTKKQMIVIFNELGNK